MFATTALLFDASHRVQNWYRRAPAQDAATPASTTPYPATAKG